LKTTGAPVGFAGPAGLAIPIYADESLRGATNRVAGANKADTHGRNVDLSRDAKVADFADLVMVATGDLCPRCGKPLATQRGIEVGHVFKLGTKYTEAFNAKFKDETQAEHTLIMGCYGIGVTRTLQAVVEQHNDADGILWPASVAPFQVGILLLDPNDATVAATAQKLSDELTALGIDNLIDDREERPGVKFKDADLIGFPLRAVVGAKSLSQGGIELKRRGEKAFTIVPVAEAASRIREKLQS
jgi:prolyl-tRNA synthetase